MIFNNGILKAQGTACRVHKRFGMNADESVADDGVPDDVVGTFAAIHEPNTVPLTGLVFIIGFEAVAFDDDWIFLRAVDDQLFIAPSSNVAFVMNVDVRSRFDM